MSGTSENSLGDANIVGNLAPPTVEGLLSRILEEMRQLRRDHEKVALILEKNFSAEKNSSDIEKIRSRLQDYVDTDPSSGFGSIGDTFFNRMVPGRETLVRA